MIAPVLKEVVMGLAIVAYLWGAWLCLPFADVHIDDDEKPYFQQRVRTREENGEGHYIPRWYAFPFFLNVTAIAAIVWLVIWYWKTRS